MEIAESRREAPGPEVSGPAGRYRVEEQASLFSPLGPSPRLSAIHTKTGSIIAELVPLVHLDEGFTVTCSQ
jgi:hypothetical protein